MKKKIDIEKLLQWAMRDELPKGKPISSSAWDIVMSYGQLGARIQTSGHGTDGFGFAPGSPHEDALVIANAVGTLDDVATFEDADHVRKLFGDLVEIAGDAVQSITLAQFNPQALVISKAIGGTRPPWEFEHPSPYPMRVEYRDATGALRDRVYVTGVDVRGGIVELQPKEVRGRAAMLGLYDITQSPRCPLIWNDPSLIHIGHARAEYFAWYSALVSLAETLTGKLSEYEPMTPSVRPMPWETGQVPSSRVLTDGLPPGVLTVKLPLAPKRHAPGRPIESEIETASRPRAAVLKEARERKRLFAGLT